LTFGPDHLPKIAEPPKTQPNQFKVFNYHDLMVIKMALKVDFLKPYFMIFGLVVTLTFDHKV